MAAGQPSTTTPTPLQCDSPNVLTLNRVPKVLDMLCLLAVHFMCLLLCCGWVPLVEQKTNLQEILAG
jgi:hypothetical protein